MDVKEICSVTGKFFLSPKELSIYPRTSLWHSVLRLFEITCAFIQETIITIGQTVSRSEHPRMLGLNLQPGTRMTFCGWPLRPGRGQTTFRCLKLRASSKSERKRIVCRVSARRRKREKWYKKGKGYDKKRGVIILAELVSFG
jgi:hypothetical protein